MGLRINTNELAIAAQRHLEENSRDISTTMARLGSGNRIVHSADDAAGLAISDRLNAQARSLGAAIKNAQDGVSLVQIYEGGTNELSNLLARIRELAMSASSDTLGDKERELVDVEVQQLTQEVTRIARTTKFGGKELLSGGNSEIDIQVGIGNDSDVDRINFNPGDTDLTANGLGISGLGVKDRDEARNSLSTLDEAINRVIEIRARVGATQSRLTATINAQGIYKENIEAARSRIVDTDYAVETANFTKQNIVRQAGAAVLAQANQAPAIALQLLKTL